MAARVIVTYGRSLMALTAAHSLGKRGVEVVGCDSVDMTVMNFSKYVSDYFIHEPYEDDVDAYLDSLEENIRKFKPDDDRPYILMPMFREVKILAEHRERFEGLIEVAVPSNEAIDMIHPKDAFARTCEKQGLPVPKTYQPQDMEELKAIENELSFPVLIKPVDDVGGRGIHKAENFNVLCDLYKESLEHYGIPPLVQQMVEGEDYCFAALCSHGEIVAHMAYKNLYQFPRDSGAGIMRETIEDTAFIETARKLLGQLKWHGIAQIDFRWSGQKEDPAYLIEVNPRFWAGLFHSVESGVDFPWLLYQLVVNGDVQNNEAVEIGAKTKVPGLWTVSALQDIAESETHFDKLKEVWQQMWNDNDKSWRKKFHDLKDALHDSVDAKDIAEKIRSMKDVGKDAKSEFASDDDPFTGLGFLFVVSSLLRHGELPPELKS